MSLLIRRFKMTGFFFFRRGKKKPFPPQEIPFWLHVVQICIYLNSANRLSSLSPTFFFSVCSFFVLGIATVSLLLRVPRCCSETMKREQQGRRSLPPSRLGVGRMPGLPALMRPGSASRHVFHKLRGHSCTGNVSFLGSRWKHATLIDNPHFSQRRLARPSSVTEPSTCS